ncbi:MAG: copper amine oxidase N-terminal domain-containing protein [Tissierellia bacterium]|nr:copper amine oxidase N-terminal domain-containing protein [Tissierellia bacterium]
MIKIRNRNLSLILVLAMLMTMFVGVGTASAAATYETLTAPSIIADPDNPQDLGSVIVTIPDKRVLPEEGTGYAEYLTISLPSGLSFSPDSLPPAITDQQEAGELKIVGRQSSANTWDLMITRNPDPASPADPFKDNKADFLIQFNKILVKNGSGNLDVTFASSGAVFPMGTATIAKIGEGNTNTLAKSVKNLSDAGGFIDSIIIVETTPGVLKANDVIELRLPSGFSWGPHAGVIVKGGWGFTGQDANFTLNRQDDQLMELKIGAGFVKSTAQTTPGRIVIGSDDGNAATTNDFLSINVDDTAKLGEVEVNVSSKTNSNVTSQDVVVANYGEYGIELIEKTTTEVIAGHNVQKIGTFAIKETIPNSLVQNRTVVIELPAGCKWVPNKLPVVKNVSGSKLIDNFTFVNGSKLRAIKATVKQGVDRTSAAELELKDGHIYVEPGFSGPIELTISGSAGAEGTVVVAECVKAVELTADPEKGPGVIIGEMNQKAADFYITETVKGAILKKTNRDRILVELDPGVYFAKKPVVTVEEGNLEIDSYKTIAGGNALEINIKYNSTKPSVIKVSEVYLTLNRTVPEGPVLATLAYVEGDVAANTAGSSALDEGYYKDAAAQAADTPTWSRVSAGDVVIATTITPAQGGGTTSFTIGSNIYTVNGLMKVMDVAPYIKNDRTYVPMRYLGEALGAEVVWDDAARTVTLTKDDTTVVFTIGSTSYTVNGEAKTADVAPEIANDRTMLPARYVAEAFDAQVGWDAGTRTVLIQQ